MMMMMIHIYTTPPPPSPPAAAMFPRPPTLPLLPLPCLPSHAMLPQKQQQQQQPPILILCAASSHIRHVHVHVHDEDESESESTSPEEGEEEASNDRSSPLTSGAPLMEALFASASQQGLASFHFPGHRRGTGAPDSLSHLLGHSVFAHDLPELPELDNLFNPQAAIAEAQQMAASLFGSESSFFLVNGSTCGIQAAVMATCPPGQTLILPRNSHMCAISGMILSGTQPAYIMPSYDPQWDIAHGIRPDDLSQAFAKLSGGKLKTKIGAVLITSPTYYGVCSDVRRIAEICHSYNVPLIVDEAHGAHFCFHEKLPESAIQQGADVVVQSTHKVLTSLTQSAMLHVQGDRVNKDILAKCLQALQSSSPSYLLLTSLDASRQQAGMHGRAGFSRALQYAKEVRDGLSEIKGLKVLDIMNINFDDAVAVDPLRITVGVWGLGLSGFEVDDKLRLEHRVVAELPSLRSITFAISLGTISQDIARLIEAFGSIAKSKSNSGDSQSKVVAVCLPTFESSWSLSEERWSPRDAFFSPRERVGTEVACGRVCCELICPYPPGIPVLVPGEKISQGAIDYLKAVLSEGGFISGASDASMNTLLVCVCE